MPIRMIAFVTASVMMSPPAVSASAPTPLSPSSPILGRWTLDTVSMMVPPDARPASVTAEFDEAGAGMWNTTYLITAKDGSTRRMTSRERLDGTAVPIAGDQAEYDSVAMSTPTPRVLVMGLAKSGHLQSVRIYTVSPDGREMTESATMAGEGGMPLIRRFRWVR